MSEPNQPQFAIEMPANVVPGVYADFANIWHTPETFVLDFAVVAQPPVQAQDDSGQTHIVVPSQIVGRVRIPAAQVFELMKALEQQLSQWELEQGQRPGGDAPPSA